MTDERRWTPIATCSYKEFLPSMGVPTQASLGKPRWWKKGTLPEDAFVWEITPRRDYLQASDAVYTQRYLAQLDGYGVERIEARFAEITALIGAEPLVLLCFEDLRAKGMDSCHRTLFAKWWLEKTGRQIPELGKTPPSAGSDEPVLDRPSLF